MHLIFYREKSRRSVSEMLTKTGHDRQRRYRANIIAERHLACRRLIAEGI